ncbi:hypothetical protein [Terriglobus sp. ADX1]|uniref:hypothetical protein n=1 Tax=Terriglobus sp. ADX1 TaxID=2794063 RepID=UPI002FE5CF7A
MTPMTFINPKLLGWLASFLNENDRETVLGDMAEEGAGYRASAMAVCGLVLRKEVERWRSISPWLVLVLLLLPCVFLMVVVTNAVTDVNAIYLWMLVNNADPDLLRQAGYWSNVKTCMPQLLLSVLALVGWSWCSGFVIGAACWRVRRSNLILIGVLVIFVQLGWIPFPVQSVLLPHGRDFIGNAAVFRNVFYRDVFPWLVLLLLVVFPAARGMNDARCTGRVVGKEKFLMITAPGVILLALVAQVFLPGSHSFSLFYCGAAGAVLHLILRDRRQIPARLQTS